MLEIDNENKKIDINIENSKNYNPKKNIKCKKIGNYVLIKTIGKGTFGKVKIGIHLPTQQKVAVKILHKSKINSQKDLERVNREIKILKSLKHKNIVQLFDSINSDKHIYLIMEYADGGDLFNYINEKRHLDETKTSLIFFQLLLAVESIHKMGIAHRDIKPENILLDEKFSIVKLVDFGLSNTYNKGEFLKTACGSPCYAAPEMISGNSYDGLASDLWSCGVVLFTMLCGHLPFDDSNILKLYEKITLGDFIIPTRLSVNSRDLLSKLLEVNPSKRITLEEIKSHPWLKVAKERMQIIYKYDSNEVEVDMDVINQIPSLPFYTNNLNCNELIKAENILQAIKKNCHNYVTTTYYILLKIKNRKKRTENKKPSISVNSSEIKEASSNKTEKILISESKINQNIITPTNLQNLSLTQHFNRQGNLRNNPQRINTFITQNEITEIDENIESKRLEELYEKKRDSKEELDLSPVSFCEKISNISKNKIINNNQPNTNFNFVVINNILSENKGITSPENIMPNNLEDLSKETKSFLNNCLNLNFYVKKEEKVINKYKDNDKLSRIFDNKTKNAIEIQNNNKCIHHNFNKFFENKTRNQVENPSKSNDKTENSTFIKLDKSKISNKMKEFLLNKLNIEYLNDRLSKLNKKKKKENSSEILQKNSHNNQGIIKRNEEIYNSSNENTHMNSYLTTNSNLKFLNDNRKNLILKPIHISQNGVGDDDDIMMETKSKVTPINKKENLKTENKNLLNILYEVFKKKTLTLNKKNRLYNSPIQKHTNISNHNKTTEYSITEMNKNKNSSIQLGKFENISKKLNDPFISRNKNLSIFPKNKTQIDKPKFINMSNEIFDNDYSFLNNRSINNLKKKIFKNLNHQTNQTNNNNTYEKYFTKCVIKIENKKNNNFFNKMNRTKTNSSNNSAKKLNKSTTPIIKRGNQLNLGLAKKIETSIKTKMEKSFVVKKQDLKDKEKNYNGINIFKSNFISKQIKENNKINYSVTREKATKDN